MNNYKVREGDSPYKIARKFGVNLGDLIASNPQKRTRVVAGVRTWQTLLPGEIVSIPLGAGGAVPEADASLEVESAASTALAVLNADEDYCTSVRHPGTPVNVAVHHFKKAWNASGQDTVLPVGTDRYESIVARALSVVMDGAPVPESCDVHRPRRGVVVEGRGVAGVGDRAATGTDNDVVAGIGDRTAVGIDNDAVVGISDRAAVGIDNDMVVGINDRAATGIDDSVVGIGDDSATAVNPGNTITGGFNKVPEFPDVQGHVSVAPVVPGGFPPMPVVTMPPPPVISTPAAPPAATNTLATIAAAAATALTSDPNHCTSVGQPGSAVNTAVHAFKTAWNAANPGSKVPVGTGKYESSVAAALTSLLGVGVAPDGCGGAKHAPPPPPPPPPVAVASLLPAVPQVPVAMRIPAPPIAHRPIPAPPAAPHHTFAPPPPQAFVRHRPAPPAFPVAVAPPHRPEAPYHPQYPHHPPHYPHYPYVPLPFDALTNAAIATGVAPLPPPVDVSIVPPPPPVDDSAAAAVPPPPPVAAAPPSGQPQQASLVPSAPGSDSGSGEKKSGVSTGMLVAGGIGAVALIGVIAAVASGKGKGKGKSSPTAPASKAGERRVRVRRVRS